MNQDAEHLNLLGIFHYVVAGLTAMFSCLPLLHLAMGIAMLSGHLDGGKNEIPAFMGWFFVVFSSLFILSGWALAAVIAMAGTRLRARRSRTFCLVVAGLSCMLMPFGTILGVFTIVVLMKDSVKPLFAPAPAAS